MKIPLDYDERQLLVELLTEYQEGVASGSITGYGESKEVELDDVATLLAKLKD